MRSLLTIAWLFIVLIARQAAAGACPATPATCNPLLNSTYISTAFTQSRAQVEAHTRRSFDALLKRTNSKTGFLTESDNAFWTSQNGWTAIADYDALRGTKLYAQQVSVAQDTMAKGTGPGVPLVNAFNDDAGWAALANLRAYAAYGDKKYLDRATEVWKASPQFQPQCDGQADSGVVPGHSGHHCSRAPKGVHGRHKEPGCESTGNV